MVANNQKIPQEGISELEALQQTLDFRNRRYLLELIGMKKELAEAINSGELNESEKIHYADAYKMAENNIQKMRMEGIL